MNRQEMLNHLKSEEIKGRWKRAGIVFSIAITLISLSVLGVFYPYIAYMTLNIIGSVSALAGVSVGSYYYIRHGI
jgi:hypothetical protein